MRVYYCLLFTICNQVLVVVTIPCNVKLIDPSTNFAEKTTWSANIDVNKNKIVFEFGIPLEMEFQLKSLWEAIDRVRSSSNPEEFPEILEVTYQGQNILETVKAVPMDITLGVINDTTNSFAVQYKFALLVGGSETLHNFEIGQFLVPGRFCSSDAHREIVISKSQTGMTTEDWKGLKEKSTKILLHPSDISPWVEVNVEVYGHSETELRIRYNTLTRMRPDKINSYIPLYTFVFSDGFPKNNRFVIGELNGPVITIFESHAHNVSIFEDIQVFVEQKLREAYQGDLSTPDLIVSFMTTTFVKAMPRKGTAAGPLQFNGVMGVGSISLSGSKEGQNRKAQFTGFDLAANFPFSNIRVLYTIEFVCGRKTETIEGAEIDFNKNQVRFPIQENFSKPNIWQKAKSLLGFNSAEPFWKSLVDAQRAPQCTIYYSREFTNVRQKMNGTHKRQFLFYKPGILSTEIVLGKEFVVFLFEGIKPLPRNWNFYIFRFPGCTVTYSGEIKQTKRHTRVLMKNVTPGAVSLTRKDMKGLNEENLEVFKKYKNYPGLLVLGRFPYSTFALMGSCELFPWKECTVIKHKHKEITDGNDTRDELEIYLGPISENIVQPKKRYPILNPLKDSKVKQIYGTWLPDSTLEIRKLDHAYENKIDFTELQKALNRDKYSILVSNNEEGDSASSILDSEAEWSAIGGFASKGVVNSLDEFGIEMLTIVYKTRDKAVLPSPPVIAPAKRDILFV